jgi:hypothetical protein
MEVWERTPLIVAKNAIPTLTRPFNANSKRKEFFEKLDIDKPLGKIIDDLIPQKKIRGKIGYEYRNFIKRLKNKRERLKEKLLLQDKLVNRPAKDKKIGIMNLSFSFNFGAVMVPFALMEVLKKMGFDPTLINFHPYRGVYKQPTFERFRKKFIKRTKVCYNEKDLRALSDDFDRYIVGSDQVWRWHYDFKHMYSWVSGFKSIISYAASFGFERLNASDEEKAKMKKYLSRFDAISVREQSGVDICKNLFDLDAKLLVDPVLLLDEGDYDKVIETENVNKIKEKYIAYMFLDEKKEAELKDSKALMELKKEYKFVNLIRNDEGDYNTVPQWLSYIKNADYVISDSFHGCVLSIIFKRQFICLQRKYGGDARILALFGSLGVDLGRFYKELEDVKENPFQKDIDYQIAFENLSVEREKAMDFLKQSLALKPVYKAPCQYEYNKQNLYGFLSFTKVEHRGDRTRMMYFLKCIPIMRTEEKKNGSVYKYLFGFIRVKKDIKK